jgi:DNA repair exonuclease SbcCD ATPase subunit
MCAERRPPKMTIPLQHYDEDFYICTTLADAQATVEALQAQVKELEESRDAWKASQECSEKAYMALVNQIPAERFDYDPVNVALLDGAKEQEIIGRKQIADLQDLLKRTDENREQWRKLCQEAQSQLTQRTAELEAAKADRDEAIREHGKESGFWGRSCARLLDKNKHLQAELERLKGREENMMHGECDICGSCEHVRHINLYVSGSEGLTVCTECEMHIVTYVRSLRQITAKVKLRMVKFYKDQQERLKKVEP